MEWKAVPEVSTRGDRVLSDGSFRQFDTITEDVSILGSAKGTSYAHKPTMFDMDDLALAKAQNDSPESPSSPRTELRLSAVRFLVVVLIGVGVVVSVMAVFLRGVTIKRDIPDPIGSSKNADGEVEFYQSISGFLTAAFGMFVEAYFAIFLAVMLTYFGNIKLYPTDTPQHGQSKVKRAALFCFVPLINYVINIGVSSLNIQHTTTGVQRVFVKDDLITMALTVPNASLAEATRVENTILRSAVLKHAVPFEIQANSPCKIENVTELDDDDYQPAMLPTVKEVRSTAVVYGFPLNSWNRAMFPKAITPSHAVTFTVRQLSNSDRAGVEKDFAAFQKDSGFDFLTGYELLLQGKTLLERSISDSNSSAHYPCTLVDGRSQDDKVATSLRRLQSATATNDTAAWDAASNDNVGTEFDMDEDDGFVAPDAFPLFTSGEHKGKRICTGAVSSLPELVNMTDKSMHTLSAFANTLAKGLNKTLQRIAPDEIDITLESYELTAQMKLTAVSIHIPYAADAPYRDVSESCTPKGKLKDSVIKELEGNATLSRDDLELYETVMCNQTIYPFDTPNSLCGSTNCVFLDKSDFGVHLRKQLLLLPYLKGCSVRDMHYDNDFLNFLPSACTPQANAVFLYGLGSYVSGDMFSFDNEGGDDASASGASGNNNSTASHKSVPFLINPRRHITLAFAKLEWEHRDLSKVFNAKCGAATPGGCDGLVFPLTNITSPGSRTSQVLLLGKENLPNDMQGRGFRNPVPLVLLNTRPFYYEKYNKYFEWEYLDREKHFGTDDDVDGGEAVAATGNQMLHGTSCSLLIDSYIQQLEVNHYFLDDPLQPLYTSAMFYLFQDAAVKAMRMPERKPAADSMTIALTNAGVRFHGDREEKEIKFSIPIVSAISTFIGIALMLLYAAIVVLFPRERLCTTDEPNAAARLAAVLTDDVYPPQVHTRRLVYPPAVSDHTGREQVELDEYVVDSITFHHERDPNRKVYM